MAITIDGTNGLTTDNAALKLDGSTLVVDDTNNRVGVGTNSPSAILHSTSVGASYTTGDVAAIFEDTTNRATARIRSITDNPSELFFDINGAVRWDLSARSSSQNYQLNLYGQHASPSYTAVSGPYITVEQSGAVLIPYQPAFHAYGTTSTASGQTIVFGNTRFNVGGHYSTSTGRFTAPVAGIYLFGWTNIGSNANDVFRYYFRVNGNNIGDIHLRQDTNATGSEYATNAMYTIPWSLNASDYVNIHYQADGSSTMYGGAANDYPRFWGYLLG